MLQEEMHAGETFSIGPRNITGSCNAQSAGDRGERPVIFSSTELLRGRREAWIEHGDQMYRLRLTHAGKLYLTK